MVDSVEDLAAEWGRDSDMLEFAWTAKAIHCFHKLRQTQVGRRLLTYSSGLTNPTSLQGSLYWPESET